MVQENQPRRKVVLSAADFLRLAEALETRAMERVRPDVREIFAEHQQEGLVPGIYPVTKSKIK